MVKQRKPSYLEMGDHKEEKEVDEEAEIYLEAKKILRTIKPCSPLDWSGPSANEVIAFAYIKFFF